MKNLIAITLLFLAYGLLSEAQDYLRAKFLSLDQAQKKWGIAAFDPLAFQKGNEKVRAAMAVDVLKNEKKYVGLAIPKIRELFGDPDGYFWSDTILAYQIQYYKDDNKESWQIVFIPDAELKKILSVKVHKKCCYQSTKLVN